MTGKRTVDIHFFTLIKLNKLIVSGDSVFFFLKLNLNKNIKKNKIAAAARSTNKYSFVLEKLFFISKYLLFNLDDAE